MRTSLIFKNKKVTILKDQNYPKFQPLEYITFKLEGYLNGGCYVKKGTVMRLVKIDNAVESPHYIYQGLQRLDRITFGFEDFTNDDVLQKEIYGAEQFINLTNDWFAKSTDHEVRMLTAATKPAKRQAGW